jgi:hypothetical protein
MMMLLLRRLYRKNLIIVPPRGHLLFAVQDHCQMQSLCFNTNGGIYFAGALGLLSKEDKNDCKRHYEYRLNLVSVLGRNVTPAE